MITKAQGIQVTLGLLKTTMKTERRQTVHDTAVMLRRHSRLAFSLAASYVVFPALNTPSPSSSLQASPLELESLFTLYPLSLVRLEPVLDYRDKINKMLLASISF